jgi:hypothetical protein
VQDPSAGDAGSVIKETGQSSPSYRVIGCVGITVEIACL